MSNTCEKLLKSCIGVDCDKMVFTGINTTAYIFNKNEIADIHYEYDDSTTPPTGSPNVVTEIVMTEVSAGVDYTGYKIEQLGKTPFTGTTTSMVEGNVMNVFTETVQFVLPDNCPDASEILDNIANGKFVVVLHNDFKGSDNRGAFQIYGAKKGLSCTAIERDAYSEDNNGGWLITLTAERCPNSALFVEHTTTTQDAEEHDVVTIDTESYLESLVSCS